MSARIGVVTFPGSLDDRDACRAVSAAGGELEADGRVVFRYVGGNPNGSRRDIAGIRNQRGNVVGLMPHPEHAIDPLTGPGTDGLGMFVSVLKALVAA